jgi:hypothetical protein
VAGWYSILYQPFIGVMPNTSVHIELHGNKTLTNNISDKISYEEIVDTMKNLSELESTIDETNKKIGAWNSAVEDGENEASECRNAQSMMEYTKR